MSYIITFTNGQIYTVLGDGTVDNGLGISLIGQNFQNYGQLIANNFVHLLENFSNTTPPANPIAGQLWWNNATEVLSFYDGNKFKPCSSSELGPIPPPGPLDGDQWWNTLTNQLNVWNGDEWMVVGPAYSKGQGFSGLTTVSVTDTSSHDHIISTIQSNAQIIALVSADPTFTLSTPIANISTVGTGITFAPSSILTGNVKVSSGYIDGTVIGSINPVNGYFSTINTSTSITNNATVLSSLAVGTSSNIITINTQKISSDSPINIISGNTSILLDSTAGTITANVSPTIAGSITTKNYVDSSDVIAIVVSETYTDTSITNLIGNTAPAGLQTLSGLAAAINNDPSFYINNNSAIGLKANKNNSSLTGTTSIAEDIAEVFEGDAIYTPGTVVVFGGTNDITTTSTYCDQRIAGVISPIATFSQDLPVSQAGKVLCNVVGPVTKGDIIVSSETPGYGIKLTNNSDFKPGCILGKSLIDDPSLNARTIMISVGRF